jgi:ribose transport system permease protein
MGRHRAAKPTLGMLWDLDAIAAAALGGAWRMGRGQVPATQSGCIILGPWASD